MDDHIFICYAREDQEFVLKLATSLKDRGVSVWLDQWSLPPGVDWDESIDSALQECAQFLIVLSPASVASKEVRGELRTALNMNKPIVPVRCQACKTPRQLQVIQIVNFTSGDPDYEATLQQVLGVLGTSEQVFTESTKKDAVEVQEEAERPEHQRLEHERTDAESRADWETKSEPTGQIPNYLDFVLEISPGNGRDYQVTVVRSPTGEAREKMHFPFDSLALENHLLALQNALLRSGGRRRQVTSPQERTVQDFGQSLFNALFTGAVGKQYEASEKEAIRQGTGLRLKLCINAPELASLPWELLYDAREGEYVCLSRHTPVMRYLDLDQSIQPLSVKPPLRILGMIASPHDLPELDISREKQHIEEALKGLRARGMVDLVWLSGQTWRDVQRAMRSGPWHIFHFVGHGGFDRNADEGFLALADDKGLTLRLNATQLGRLLADQRSLRLAVLNACEGGRGSDQDVFSSTAATLVRRGIPAVLAMQHEISDEAAVEFARAFYEPLAEDGLPVDAAVAEARKAISLAIPNTVEWGTPVLYMRSPEGVLFNLEGEQEQTQPEAEAARDEDEQRHQREVEARQQAEQEQKIAEQARRGMATAKIDAEHSGAKERARQAAAGVRQRLVVEQTAAEQAGARERLGEAFNETQRLVEEGQGYEDGADYAGALGVYEQALEQFERLHREAALLAERQRAEAVRHRLAEVTRDLEPLTQWAEAKWAAAKKQAAQAEQAWQAQQYGSAAQEYERAAELYEAARIEAEEVRRLQQAAEASRQAEQQQQTAEQAQAPQYAPELYQQASEARQQAEQSLKVERWEETAQAFGQANELFIQAIHTAQREKARQAAEAGKERALTSQHEALEGKRAEFFPERLAEASLSFREANQAFEQADFSTAQTGFERSAGLYQQISQDMHTHLQREQAEQARARAQELRSTAVPDTKRQQKQTDEAFRQAERLFKEGQDTAALTSYEEVISRLTALQSAAEETTLLQRSATASPPAPSVKRKPLLVLGAAGLLTVSLMSLYLTNRLPVFFPSSTPSPVQSPHPQPESVPHTPDTSPQRPPPVEAPKPPPASQPDALASSPPRFTTVHPKTADITIKEGEKLRFGVEAQSSQTLKYAWFLDGKKQAQDKQWTYEPDNLEGGTKTKQVTVTVTDLDDRLAERSWAVRVRAAKRPRPVTPPSPQVDRVERGAGKTRPVPEPPPPLTVNVSEARVTQPPPALQHGGTPRLVTSTPDQRIVSLFPHQSRLLGVQIEVPGVGNPSLDYSWTVNGRPATGGEIFEFRDQPIGTYEVIVTIATPSGRRLNHSWTIEVCGVDETEAIPPLWWPRMKVYDIEAEIDPNNSPLITVTGKVQSLYPDEDRRSADNIVVEIIGFGFDNIEQPRLRAFAIPTPQPLGRGEVGTFRIVVASDAQLGFRGKVLAKQEEDEDAEKVRDRLLQRAKDAEGEGNWPEAVALYRAAKKVWPPDERSIHDLLRRAQQKQSGPSIATNTQANVR